MEGEGYNDLLNCSDAINRVATISYRVATIGYRVATIGYRVTTIGYRVATGTSYNKLFPESLHTLLTLHRVLVRSIFFK